MSLGEPRIPTICAGENFILVLEKTEDGTSIKCWGTNDLGQLGFIKFTGKEGKNLTIPEVDIPRDVVIATGAKHTVIVANGNVYSMGDKRRGILGHEMPFGMVRFPRNEGSATVPKIASVSSYDNFTVAIASNGENLYGWGVGQRGSLGIGNFAMEPVVFKLPKVTGIESIQRAIQVSVGSEHCIILTDDGNVFTWGAGKNGRLGHGDTLDRMEPKRLESFVGGTGQQVIQVAAGEAHCMTLDEKGQVYTWGSGSYGRLGLGGMSDQGSPSKVGALANIQVTWISCSEDHSLAVSNIVDGISLFTWGSGKFGKLGHGTSEKIVGIPEPVYKFVDAKRQVIEATCGPRYTVCKAISRGGIIDSEKKSKKTKIELWAFGKCPFLFDEKEDWTVNVPTMTSFSYESEREARALNKYQSVTMKEFKARAKAVQAGNKHALALCEGGLLSAWGENSHGQLGVGSVEIATSPMKLQMKEEVLQIACGALHSLALTKSSHLYSWGSNSHGQLGLNDTTNRNYPCLVETLQGSKVRKIAAGGLHSAAVCKGPQVAIWGSNDFGQLGLDKKEGLRQLHPEIIPSKTFMTKFTKELLEPYDFELALGTSHTMVLVEVKVKGKNNEKDTFLFTAGRNDSSQLGSGDRSQSKALLEHVSIWEDYLEGEMQSSTSGETQPYITQIAAGDKMSTAVVAKKELYMWGELIGISKKRYNEPHKVLLSDFMINQGSNLPVSLHSLEFVDISLGVAHVLAIVRLNKNTQKLISWGSTSYGRLGIGNISQKQVGGEEEEDDDDDLPDKLVSHKDCGPIPVSEKSLEEKSTPYVIESFRECTRVASGGRQSFAVNPKSGHVYAWGHAARGKLGLGDDVVVVTEPLEIRTFNNPKVEDDKGGQNEVKVPISLEDEDEEEVDEKSGGAMDTKHGPGPAATHASSKASKAPKKSINIIQELSAKSFNDLNGKIDMLHEEYRKRFLDMITVFDDLEKGVGRAKMAILSRLGNQKLAVADDKDMQTWTKTTGLSPIEQVLGRLYLDPRLMFELFKLVHDLFKHWREKTSKEMAEGEVKMNQDKVPEDMLKKRRAFPDLVFLVYDLDKKADERRFQVFFRLCVQYVLEPREGGETRMKDFIREDMPLWFILSRAVGSGKTRGKVAEIFCHLLRSKEVLRKIEAKVSESGDQDLAIAQFARDADVEDDGSNAPKANDEYPLMLLGNEIVRMMTSTERSEQDSSPPFALQFQQAGSWLLDIIYVCIEERALKFEQSVRAYAKQRGAVEVPFRKLARRRFCIAYVKALLQVAIDTTHYRRLWAQLHGDTAARLQDSENFVLHMLRSRQALKWYFSRRQDGPWVPSGAVLQDLEKSPAYSKDNLKQYSQIDIDRGELVIFGHHCDRALENEGYDKFLAPADYLFGLANKGARRRLTQAEQAIHLDHMLLRSTPWVRNVVLDWNIQIFLLQTFNVPEEQREQWKLKELETKKSFNEYRIVPFFIERNRSVICDKETGMWIPEGLDDVLNKRMLPDTIQLVQKESKEATTDFDGLARHRISIEDCLIMYKVLQEEQCIEIMKKKTGEGAWKSLIHFLRQEVDELKNNPELREQFEKTKNNLLIIKDSDAKTSLLLGDTEISGLRLNMLDPSLLYLRLKAIMENQIKKLKFLRENIGNYRNALTSITQQKTNIEQEIEELRQIYICVTGPHSEEVSLRTKFIQQREKWLKERHKTDKGTQLTYKQNPVYMPKAIQMNSRQGGMQIKTYSQLVNKDGVNDCVACILSFSQNPADVILRRTTKDPSECCMCLLCPEWCFSTKFKEARFLKNLRFYFILTEKPYLFNMKIAVQNSGEEEILLHTLVSKTELREHLTRLEEGVDREEKVIDQQPGSTEGIGGKMKTLHDTRPLNLAEVRSPEKKRIHLDTSLAERPKMVHKNYMSRYKSHLHYGFLFILFDPLGTTVNIPGPVPFVFSVEHLVQFLADEFPPVPTGFLAEMESPDVLNRREMLLPADIS